MTFPRFGERCYYDLFSDLDLVHNGLTHIIIAVVPPWGNLDTSDFPALLYKNGSHFLPLPLHKGIYRIVTHQYIQSPSLSVEIFPPLMSESPKTSVPISTHQFLSMYHRLTSLRCNTTHLYNTHIGSSRCVIVSQPL